MAREQSILLGETGQALVLEVPEGRPSSDPRARIYDQRYDPTDSTQPVADSSSAGTIARDSVSTTFASASGVSQTNPKTLNLTSGTGVTVGRVYLATNAGGQKERIEIAKLSSNTGTATQGLAFDYTSADTFVSTRCTYTPASALFSTTPGSEGWLGDEGNLGNRFAVRWDYTVSSVNYVTWTYFTLVRRRFTSLLTAQEFAAYIPDMAGGEWGEQFGKRFQPQIDLAQGDVTDELAAIGIEIDKVRSPDAVRRLIAYRAAVRCGAAGMGPAGIESVVFRDWWDKEYREWFTKVSATQGAIAVDTDDDGLLTAAEVKFTQPFLVR